MSILNLTKAGAFLAAAALSAVPARAVAQGGVELVPWAGAYIPTKSSVNTLVGLSRDVDVMGGARLTFWGSGHLGFEAVGGYSPAKVGGETLNERKFNLLAAAGRLMLAVTPTTNRVAFYIAGGPALLTRGRNTFDDDRSHTDFGANFGAGFRFGLGQSNNAAIRLDLEDYMYNGDFGGGDAFQNDLVTSIGLAIPIGGHSGEHTAVTR